MKAEYYRQIVESLPYAVIVTNQQGVIEGINAQAALLFGYSQQELHDKNIDILIASDRLSRQQKSYINNTNPVSHFQMDREKTPCGLTKAGIEFPVKIKVTPLSNDKNNKILITVIDITESEHVTKELKRVSSELNDFVRIASHDLKAPLRGIIQISSWVEEDIADFASDNTKKNLALLMQRATRLEKYLKDLLAYSRINCEFGDTQTITIKALVLNTFNAQAPPNDASIIYDGKLSEITSYEAPLETIFSHLISNAIKHKNEGPLDIHIYSQESPTHYSFSVRDNGSGIAEQHHNKIFELFNTLKPRDDVEGSGMGLSIIKKLLDFHNCEINISSDGKNGSCFTFTWPKVVNSKNM